MTPGSPARLTESARATQRDIGDRVGRVINAGPGWVRVEWGDRRVVHKAADVEVCE